MGGTGQLGQPRRGFGQQRGVAPAAFPRIQQGAGFLMRARRKRHKPLFQRGFPQLGRQGAAETGPRFHEKRRALGMERAPHGKGQLGHAVLKAHARLVLQFVEHVARHEQMRGAHLAESLHERRAHQPDRPLKLLAAQFGHALQKAPSHFHRTRDRIHADERQRQRAPIRARQPEGQRQGQGPASQVRDRDRMLRVAGRHGQIEPRQEAAQPHQIPRQKIPQIGRDVARRAPVGTAKAAALVGQHGGKIADGLREIGAVVARKRHHRIKRLRQKRERLAHEGIGGPEKRAAQRMPRRLLC